MSGQIVIRSSAITAAAARTTYGRREPVSNSTRNPKNRHKKTSSNVGEVAGGTTADICVVCCCCPCVLFEFLILAVYKLPVNVVRRMWKSQRQKIFINKRKNKGGIIQHAKEVQQNNHCQHPSQQVVGYIDELSDVDLKEFEKVKVSIDGSAEAIELDKQMWDRFREAGFWRSPSQGFE